MVINAIRRALQSNTLVPCQDTRVLDVHDQDELDRVEQFRRDLEAKLKLAGYRSEPLKQAFTVQLEILDLLVQTQIATRQILRVATHAANQVNRPSETLKAHLAKMLRALAWEQRLQFSWMATILFAAVSGILGTIIAWSIIEAHRDTPEAAALRAAAGGYPAGWTRVILQNDLPSMVTFCAKSQLLPAPNGRHYCYVPLIMDGVEAKPPSPILWDDNSARGQSR